MYPNTEEGVHGTCRVPNPPAPTSFPTGAVAAQGGVTPADIQQVSPCACSLLLEHRHEQQHRCKQLSCCADFALVACSSNRVLAVLSWIKHSNFVNMRCVRVCICMIVLPAHNIAASWRKCGHSFDHTRKSRKSPSCVYLTRPASKRLPDLVLPKHCDSGLKPSNLELLGSTQSATLLGCIFAVLVRLRNILAKRKVSIALLYGANSHLSNLQGSKSLLSPAL